MNEFKQAFDHAARLHNGGKIAEACAIYDRLLAQAPGDPFLLYAYGTACSQSNMFGLAINMLRQSTEANPSNHEAWHNLGLSYRNIGQVEKGISAYQRVLAMDLPPDQKVSLYGNLSGCYINEGCPEKAIHYANLGLAIQDRPQLRNHKALALLEMGDYLNGFKLYEARYELPEFTKRDFGDAPKWDGSPVKVLAIHGEQGLGDEIHFLTTLAKVLPLVEECHIECAVRLLGVLKHSFRNEPKVKLYTSHQELSARVKPDAWIGMGSLPALTWPWQKNVWLKSSRTYRKGQWPRVGISWKGGTLKTHEYHRNAPIEDWKQFVWGARANGVEVISVQYGPADDVAKHLDIEHDAASIADMDTLTGMIQSCDLVVSVCNTTVHQAGASGTPCWQLVPAKPDWRWGQTGEECYWYDSVSFIRQRKDEAWSSVLATATSRLQEWAKTKQTALVE